MALTGPARPVHRLPAVTMRLAFCTIFGLALAACPLAAQAQTMPLLALSEIPQEDVPAAQDDPQLVPLPDPIERRPLPPADGEPSGPAVEPADEGEPADADGRPLPAQDGTDNDAGDDAAAGPLPEIVYGEEALPEPVRRMRSLIIEAARSGDVEALRPLIGMGAGATQLTFAGGDDDPIEFLRSISGDGEGQEILAILIEVLQAGHVHLEAGTPQELYVWPYFFAVPLEGLDPRQRVELFTLVTAGDYEEMKSYGAYNFYRAGITPDGEWAFFVAGD